MNLPHEHSSKIAESKLLNRIPDNEKIFKCDSYSGYAVVRVVVHFCRGESIMNIAVWIAIAVAIGCALYASSQSKK